MKQGIRLIKEINKNKILQEVRKGLYDFKLY